MNTDFYKTKLKSGVTLLFEKRKLPVTTIVAATRAGAAYETEKDKGIAHFTEHMLFKGTEKRTQQEISKEIERVGGILNGFTAEQITTFWCKLPSQHSSLGSDVIFDVVKNAKFDEKEVEKEKGVILAEINRKHDLPQIYVLDKIKELLYEKPFALSVLGTKETVTGMNRDTFLRWHNFYNPRNLILSIVGKFSIEELSEVAKKYFSEEKDFPLPEVSMHKINSQAIEERKGIEQTHFCLGFHAPSLSDKARYVSEVFNAVLGEGMSSILFQEVREKRGWAYHIASYLEQEKDYGFCAVYAGIEKKNLEKVKEIVLKEIKSLKDLKARDFEEAKEQKIGNWQLTLENSEKVAPFLVMQEIATKAEDFYNYPEKISEVKLQQVRDLAKIGNYSLAVVAPK